MSMPNDKQRILALEIKVAELTWTISAMLDAGTFARDDPNINYACSQCGRDTRNISGCSQNDCMHGLNN